MSIRRTALFIALASLLVASQSQADPCGMVPPVYTGQGTPIERVGTQKTYVFFKRGVESVVIRPGFRGKVDNFGMLIPFPSVPALRKMPDNIFAHVKSAIDPPEVVMYVYRPRPRRRYSPMVKSAAPARSGAGLKYDQVKVLKQEAVGMYQVAVLAAGSAAALKRWMDSHGYKYPKGMDKPCNEYVQMGWCFVAVKTKVGQKKGVNPRPGMRRARSKLPKGSTFNGSVQAMGFHFKTKKLVVPMRLSAFNAGRLRNIVYILTNGPRRVDRIPEKYVMRQLSGRELYRNLTRPLPLRVIGGTIKQLNSYQKSSLKTRRDPKPHNGHAASLFAADLLAVRRGRLSHPFEERKKYLLAIGERLQLRGAAIDALNRQALKKEEGRATKGALRRVRQMTLSVVDGDFRRDVLAKYNLTFSHYRMPKDLNNQRRYNARFEGPGSTYNRGKLYKGSLDAPQKQRRKVKTASATYLAWALLGLFALLLVARGRKRSLIFTLLFLLTLPSSASAGGPAVRDLLRDLGDGKKAPAAAKQLIRKGAPIVRKLLDVAFDDSDPVRRGWALVCVGEIGDTSADKELKQLHDNPNHSLLVRTWAAAVRIKLAGQNSKRLLALASLANRFPATKRPLGKQLMMAFARQKGAKAVESMLTAATRMYSLRSALAGAILAKGPKPLVRLMATSPNQAVRRLAAGYVASLAAKDPQTVAKLVVKAYRFRRRAQRVPWAGGPLFVPGMRWQQKSARRLAASLIRWHVWADVKGENSLKRQIHNNLRSLSFARAAGYRSPGWSQATTERWLRIWKDTVGAAKVRALLLEQGYSVFRRYRQVLDK
jgi:hypothetical protein